MTALTASDVDFESVASEEEDRASSPATFEISTFPADYTLEVLAHQWQQGRVSIPEFQRGYVWNQTQASRLIESFLLGLPVPPVFLYAERKSKTSLVVDGQQRLRSVIYFFEGYFGEETSRGTRPVFRLKGLPPESPYANLTFSELEDQMPETANDLKNTVMRATIIKQIDPQDDTSIYHIFERLNTGGTLLHNQEVRNALNSGSFNQLLMSLNEDENWRKILGKPRADSRMRDIELILRFFSLLEDRASYTKPMKDFMSTFMKANRNPDEDQITLWARQFTEACEWAISNFGEKPFHFYAGFNSSAFDAIMCAHAINPGASPVDIQDRFDSLKSNLEFEGLIRGGTTDKDQVLRRFDLAQAVMFGG